MNGYEEEEEITACKLISHSRINLSYAKKGYLVFIRYDVVTTLRCSTLIFSSLTISVRYKCAATFSIAISLSLKHEFHILTDIKFKHVTSTYYHS